MSGGRLTIGITTRNRPQALRRCLESLDLAAPLAAEVIVFDDGSTTPVDEQVAGVRLSIPLRILREATGPGLIVGRNRLVREAATPAVLLMDDDAALVGREGVERALDVLEGDAQVAAVAFAQVDRHGTRWHESMQPSRCQTACYVPAFIGFAHLLRCEAFLAIGGYRESFVFYGEEKELCLRLIEAGYRTVYLPDAVVMHEPDPAGRSQQRYLRHVTKNDCLNALYNEPWYRLAWMLPGRLALYFRMRRAWKVDDPWGWAWILRELSANAGTIARDRRPVSAATLATWKRLQRTPEPYTRIAPDGAAYGRPREHPSAAS